MPQMPNMEAPQMPQASNGLTQDEMKQNLQDLMSSTDSKMRDVFAKKFQSDNIVEEKRQMELKKVLEMMQELGVDVHDPESINQFLMKIQEANPDMYEIIVDALNSLMSGEPAPEIPLEMMEAGMGAPEAPQPAMGEGTPMNVAPVPASPASPANVPPGVVPQV